MSGESAARRASNLALLTAEAERLLPAPGAPWPRLLERVLCELLPVELATWPEESWAERLATTWNLLEGLYAAPAWMAAYAGARAGELARVSELRPFLEGALAPVLAPPSARRETPRLELCALDTRPLARRFLPGELWLAAPRVMVVADRRHRSWLALLLAPGAPTLVGPIAELPAAADLADGTGQRWTVTAERLEVGGARLPLPGLLEPERGLAAAGFVVLTAADSQRLWVVEER